MSKQVNSRVISVPKFYNPFYLFKQLNLENDFCRFAQEDVPNPVWSVLSPKCKKARESWLEKRGMF
ncbi:hypothetical protein DLM78_02860 [Leptospira stimsonii]|uniref:Uncharacterized protein n=1 Tax=Leptospira stimsonii TaxID=2202203 RepID=A0A8B6RZ62_9LEPT|nr:hypothetical protein DLM78_02860 [Leptospira stimsonii]